MSLTPLRAGRPHALNGWASSKTWRIKTQVASGATLLCIALAARAYAWLLVLPVVWLLTWKALGPIADLRKTIHDSLGHAPGGDVLPEFARRPSGCVRTTDIVTGLGGDEISIVLEGLHPPGGAFEVAAKTRRAVAPEIIARVGKCNVTARIGIAIYRRGAARQQSHAALLTPATASPAPTSPTLRRWARRGQPYRWQGRLYISAVL